MGVGASPITSCTWWPASGRADREARFCCLGQPLWTLPLEGAQRLVRLVVTDGLGSRHDAGDNGTGRVMALADPTDPRLLALRSRSTATPTQVPSATAPVGSGVRGREPSRTSKGPARPHGTGHSVRIEKPAHGRSAQQPDPHRGAADGKLEAGGARRGQARASSTSPSADPGRRRRRRGGLRTKGRRGNHGARGRQPSGGALERGRPSSYVGTIGRLGTGNGTVRRPVRGPASMPSTASGSWDGARQRYPAVARRTARDVSNVRRATMSADRNNGSRPFVREDAEQSGHPRFRRSPGSRCLTSTGAWLRNYGSLPEEGLRIRARSTRSSGEAAR